MNKSSVGVGLIVSGLLIAGGIYAWSASHRTTTERTADGKGAPRAVITALEYTPTPIGGSVEEFGRPYVTHVDLVDLDRDGLLDVIYCEAQKSSIRWIRQAPRGVFTEKVLATGISGPAHVAAADLNGTGRLDVLVASMGQILPTNDRIGAIVASVELVAGSITVTVPAFSLDTITRLL